MRRLTAGTIAAAAWWGLAFVMLAKLGDAPIFNVILSVVVAAPVVLAVSFHQRFRTPMTYLFDLTALVYCGTMVWVYVDVRYLHPNAQAAIALALCPVYALTIILIEAIAFQKWRRNSTGTDQNGENGVNS